MRMSHLVLPVQVQIPRTKSDRHNKIPRYVSNSFKFFLSFNQKHTRGGGGYQGRGGNRGGYNNHGGGHRGGYDGGYGRGGYGGRGGGGHGGYGNNRGGSHRGNYRTGSK